MFYNSQPISVIKIMNPSQPLPTIVQKPAFSVVGLLIHTVPMSPDIPQLWDKLDVSYFMRHDAVEIGWHARMLSRHVRTLEPVVRARPSPVGEGLQVLVYAPDQEDLFARICGYFDHSGFSIQDARNADRRHKILHLDSARTGEMLEPPTLTDK